MPTIPSHVPPNLVYHFDIYERLQGDGDYHQWFTELHQQGYPDLFWTTSNGGHWVVIRGELFNEVITQPEIFSSSINIVPVERAMGTKPFPITLDPPEHTKYRAILNGTFSPQAVIPLGEQAQALTIELIESFHSRGECEFMTEVARILPISIFMKMVGLPPSDTKYLLGLVDEMVRPTDVAGKGAGLGLIEYAHKTVLERRANPGEDLLSQLAHTKVDDELLTVEQLTGMTILLLLGGLDTVAAVLGFMMNYLARHPEQRIHLVENPDEIPKAVEEILRRFPVSSLARVIIQNTVLDGCELKEDDMILCPTMAHSLDDRLFTRPTSIDFDRKPGFNGTFGAGAHRCLGSMLARVELRAFLQEWLQRIPDFHVKGDTKLTVETGFVVALEKLPLVWKL